MIPRKRKVCKGCNTPQYLFSGGLCRNCWGGRPSKASRSPIRVPIYRRSNMRGSKVPLKGKKPNLSTRWGFTKQYPMFVSIWVKMDRPRVCPISNKKLDSYWGTDQFTWCFAHILPKSTHPLYKLNPDNIMVIHPEAHTLIDQGTKKQREQTGWNFEVFYNRREELKKEYEKFAKTI